MSLPNPAASVDLGREEEIESLRDELEEAMYEVKRAHWMTAEEREDTLLEMFAAGIDAVTDTGVLDPVDGTIIRASLDRIREIVRNVLAGDPERLRRRAERARKRGKGERAQALLERAAKVEARRGNGGGGRG